jgi:hypothetical protein
LHFVYGPPHTDKKKAYWKKWKHFLREDMNKNRTILFGDLNEIFNPHLDRVRKNTTANAQTTVEQATLHLLKMSTKVGLLDAFRWKHGDTKEYTFLRTYIDGSFSLSRIDHFLVDPYWTELINEMKIHSLDRNLSSDHHAISLSLQLPKQTLKIKEKTKREVTKIEMIDTKNLMKKQKEYREVLEEPLGMIREDDKNWKLESLKTNLKRLSRAISSSLDLQDGDAPTKKINKLSSNQPSYNPPPLKGGSWEAWRAGAREIQSQLDKQIKAEKRPERYKNLLTECNKVREYPPPHSSRK